MDSFDRLVDAAAAAAGISYSRWIAEELFSPSWFIITATLAIACALLFILIDKSRLREILLFGALLAFLFGYTDAIATEYGLWEYKTRIIPVMSNVFPFSYTMNPLFHMLAYQYGNTWRSFVLLNTAVAALFAFVAHPFYVWAGMLWLGNWSYFYSFIYLISVPVGVRALTISFTKIEQQHTTENRRASLFAAFRPALKLLGDDKDKDK